MTLWNIRMVWVGRARNHRGSSVPNGGRVRREKSTMQRKLFLTSFKWLQREEGRTSWSWEYISCPIVLPRELWSPGQEASQEMVDNYGWILGCGMECMTPSRASYLYQSRLQRDKEYSRGCHIIICVARFL